MSLQSGVKNSTEETAEALEVKAVLNRVQRWDVCVCRSVAMGKDKEGRATPSIHVRLSAREGSRPKCPRCQRRCPEHGVHVESLPWSNGKSPVSIAMMLFLATWARRLS